MKKNKISLDFLYIVDGTTVFPFVSLKISIGGQSKKGIFYGDDIVDAIFNGIESLTGIEAKLLDSYVSIIEKKVTVKLEKNSKEYFGECIDKNIVLACAKAYIDCLNKVIS